MGEIEDEVKRIHREAVNSNELVLEAQFASPGGTDPKPLDVEAVMGIVFLLMAQQKAILEGLLVVARAVDELNDRPDS